jgi:hypothetical protein
MPRSWHLLVKTHQALSRGSPFSRVSLRRHAVPERWLRSIFVTCLT